MKSILTEIIKENRTNPKESKEIMIKVDKTLNKIKKNIKAEVMLGGSAAKGTFLKNDFDCDIFVRFDYDYKDKNISKLLQTALKSLKPTKVHGSRDYFQLKIDNINYEIIPVLKVKDPKKALNVTDMSPLHVAWVKKHLNSKLKNEIILAKLFCKAQKVYGAESYINGFSGHVLDILVIYYNGFENLLKESLKWKVNQVIDISKHYKDSKQALKTLNKSKKTSPLIIIDPIQPERNAVAALSIERFEKFKSSARKFLNNPSKEFFQKKEVTIDDLKQLANTLNSNLSVIEAESLKGKEDIVGTKILKVFQYISKQLTLNEFTTYDKDWQWDKKKALLWFITKKETLSKQKEHMGPPTKTKIAAKKFKEKHKKTYTIENRLYAKVDREFRKAEDLIKYLINTEYIKERTKKAKFSQI